jgi:hypothetical protein
MLIAILLVTLIGALVTCVTLIAVGNLAIRLEGIAEQIATADEDNKLQHRIDRGYLGNALLEQKVLPLLGYKKPERSAFEKQLLAEVSADPSFQ